MRIEQTAGEKRIEEIDFVEIVPEMPFTVWHAMPNPEIEDMFETRELAEQFIQSVRERSPSAAEYLFIEECK